MAIEFVIDEPLKGAIFVTTKCRLKRPYALPRVHQYREQTQLSERVQHHTAPNLRVSIKHYPKRCCYLTGPRIGTLNRLLAAHARDGVEDMIFRSFCRL